ncbi:Late embryogenesis abundant protein [Sesbania bispinosa]|nr:Late embryogenesis abundant protein [Sesbania bispinosa]
MSCGMKCSKGLKICCGVTAIVVIVLLVVLVVLFLTVFKPKDPTIILRSVEIERLILVLPTFDINASLGIVVTVENPNHGSFRYHNSTAYLNYRGNLMAEAPILEDTIPARDAHNISTSLNVFADVTKFPDLLNDYTNGIINFTSTTTLQGKVRIMDLFKIKATSYSTCYLSVFVHDNIVNSTCNIQIEL